MNAPLRILIADDHDVVREGVRVLVERQPEWKVCGQATDGLSAVEQAEELQPDIVILDMTMPGLNGLEAARRIRKQRPETEVLILTGHLNDELIRKVFEAGVKSFLGKTETSEHLVKALQSLAQHKPYFTDAVSEVLFARMLQKTAPKRADAGEDEERLTPREREI